MKKVERKHRKPEWYEKGIKLREDSSREFVEKDENLKFICQKIGYTETENRESEMEFELLQKMTTTQRSKERLLKEKKYKEFYGVSGLGGPYRYNKGKKFFGIILLDMLPS